MLNIPDSPYNCLDSLVYLGAYLEYNMKQHMNNATGPKLSRVVVKVIWSIYSIDSMDIVAKIVVNIISPMNQQLMGFPYDVMFECPK